MRGAFEYATGLVLAAALGRSAMVLRLPARTGVTHRVGLINDSGVVRAFEAVDQE